MSQSGGSGEAALDWIRAAGAIEGVSPPGRPPWGTPARRQGGRAPKRNARPSTVEFWRRARAFFASYHRRAGVDRQRWVLPLHGLRRRTGRCRHRPHQDQGLLPPDQRKSRALQPDPAQRVGLRAAYRSEAARTRALDTWLHMYNHHRHHTAIGGPPISRVNNVVGSHIWRLPGLSPPIKAANASGLRSYGANHPLSGAAARWGGSHRQGPLE